MKKLYQKITIKLKYFEKDTYEPNVNLAFELDYKGYEDV